MAETGERAIDGSATIRTVINPLAVAMTIEVNWSAPNGANPFAKAL
jgi:hypothetical protein